MREAGCGSYNSLHSKAPFASGLFLYSCDLIAFARCLASYTCPWYKHVSLRFTWRYKRYLFRYSTTGTSLYPLILICVQRKQTKTATQWPSLPRIASPSLSRSNLSLSLQLCVCISLMAIQFSAAGQNSAKFLCIHTVVWTPGCFLKQEKECKQSTVSVLPFFSFYAMVKAHYF